MEYRTTRLTSVTSLKNMNVEEEISTFTFNWVIDGVNWKKIYGTPVKFEFKLGTDMEYSGSMEIVKSTWRNIKCKLNCKNKRDWNVSCYLRTSPQANERWFMLSQDEYIQEFRYYDYDTACPQPNIEWRITHINSVVTSIPKFPTKKIKVNHDYSKLFETKKYSDISFQVGDQNIRAHKNIVSCSSAVFEAMFEHQMSEKITNIVLIEDMEPAVFEEMLRFIYCNEGPNLKTYADKLLQASEKYDLPVLKNRCEEELASMIAIENAVETLILADLYSAKQLKEWALNFIINNRKAVTQTQGFKDKLETHSRLLVELLKKTED